jgi:hypothetical protein
VLKASGLPRLRRFDQTLAAFATGRLVEHVEEMRVGFRIDAYLGLVEQRILGCSAGFVDHEFRAGFALALRSAVDQVADVFTDAEIDGAGGGIA